MTRNLPEPLPDARLPEKAKTPGLQRVRTALDDLLAWAELNHHTGVGILRVNFNQGGPTTARPLIEEPLPQNT